MARTEEYFNRLAQLKAKATNLIDEIRNMETPLENAINPTCEETKRAYVKESKKLIDMISQEALNQLDKEESRLGPMAVKTGMGMLAWLLDQIADRKEWAREFLKPAVEAYEMDQIMKRRIKQAAGVVKQRVEGVLSMKREEFTKSLKGGRVLRRLLESMIKEELTRLQ